MESDRIKNLREKISKGEYSLEELQEFYAYIRAHGTPEEWEDFLQQQWNLSPKNDGPYVPDALFPEILKLANWRRRLKGYKELSVKIAASLILLAAATGLFLHYRTPIAAYAESHIMVTHTLPAGQLAKYTLPDGSVVWLNAGSTLTHPRFFLSAERRVSLAGEAFFNVTRNESKPFLIQAEALQVKVLGTSFNVKAYPGSINHSVSVASGLVQVNDDKDSLTVLSKGLQLSYAVEQHHYSIEHRDPALANHWTTGGLKFDNASFEEVAQALEKHFGIQVMLESKNTSCRFTVVMPRDLSLEQVLEKLKLINDFEYSKGTEKIIISQINC